MSNDFTITTEADFAFEVICTECGRSLENVIEQTTTRFGNPKLVITTEPCETCVEKARDEVGS